jgi:hypothetical protein
MPSERDFFYRIRQGAVEERLSCALMLMARADNPVEGVHIVTWVRQESRRRHPAP